MTSPGDGPDDRYEPDVHDGEEHEGDEVVLDSDSFQPHDHTPKLRWDDEEPDPEATTYPGDAAGPAPVPTWVITENAARQYDLGVIKTGKEAEVVLVERTLGDRSNRLAAKRYRALIHRGFRNDSRYRAGRATGDQRADRAAGRGTRKGRQLRAQQWAEAEFDALCRLWSAGAPVPYPVQLMGTEVILELIGSDTEAAPRLAEAGARGDELAAVAAQAVDVLRLMTATGIVHGDLSPYNTLWWEGRLWVIDFPQWVDVTTAEGLELLRRDVDNLIGWLARKRAPVDPDEIYAELAASRFGGAIGEPDSR